MLAESTSVHGQMLGGDAFVTHINAFSGCACFIDRETQRAKLASGPSDMSSVGSDSALSTSDSALADFFVLQYVPPTHIAQKQTIRQ